MARRLLSSSRALALCLGSLACGACKHEHPAPPRTEAPAPAAADSVTENTRAAHFDTELKRAHARWLEKPDLAGCTNILSEKADAELCRTAQAALEAVERMDPAVTPEVALPKLGDASLALVRLLERVRYLNFEDFGQRHRDDDAGAPSASAPATRRPSAAPAAPRSTASAALLASADAPPQAIPRGIHGLLREPRTLKLVDSPLMRLVENTARIERDVVRNLSAYLEYAPLPVRRAAFEVVKQLQADHAQWPTLNHALREASVLETDSALKQSLSDLANSGLPRGKRPNQPTGSK